MKPGDWLRRKHDKWELIQVVAVTRDGGVRVRLGDHEIDTTTTYLDYQFEAADQPV